MEIAKLALWLHSARAAALLSALDHIREGNSLVGPEFWAGRPIPDAARRERVNAFDWKANFPEVWPDGAEDRAAGGFDIVLGNPPYVKLQNLRAVDPEVADWLQAERGEDTFQSARTGNFDLYLPFIEKGLRLLGSGGRMAYIAPSLWSVNRYGEGLRRLVARTRQLDRWVDFKAFQVFDEAITYTALQFFTRDPKERLRIAAAPSGDLADIDWADAALAVPYADLPGEGEWLMATGAERALIGRLAATCLRLDDPSLTSGIVVGVQTSADAVYHLERLGSDRYRCRPKGAAPYEVAIEDAIMKPLVSGGEAKRYEAPRTDTYLLFPYERTAGGAMRLLPEADMAQRFPRAWKHLQSWQKALRARERSAFDDDAWWRFGRIRASASRTSPS
ncbi:MAG: Eco57I restriction-modification methylase domain-containing protein [Caulobacteraceae bacterium]